MRCWLVTIGEPVPVSPNRGDRLHRAGFLAQLLSENGHDVTWWTSTFDHFRKNHLFKNDTTAMLNERLRVVLLHGCGYRSNMSLARLADHKLIAKKFARLARIETESPDIILTSLPTTDLCLESVRYGKINNIPVVLDMRDMWPDIFVDHSPKLLRPFVKSVLNPMLRSAHHACSNATAITGITDAFVDWGLQRGNRIKSDIDRSFPHGYISRPPSNESLHEARDYWDGLGILADSRELIVSYIGSIGRQLDIDIIFKALDKLNGTGRSIRAVICGTGDFLEHFKRMAAGLDNIYFPGWVDSAKIHVLMRRSSVGLDPLPDRYDFLATINNKAIEYLSAGLPVISSPNTGVLAELLKNHRCGISYACGDADALANILANICDNPSTLKSMSDNAYELFKKMFIAENVYTEMMEYLVHITQVKKPIAPYSSKS